MIPFIDGNSSSIPEPEVNLGNLEAKYVPLIKIVLVSIFITLKSFDHPVT